MVDEHDLMARAQHGDVPAYEQLVRQYEQLAFRVAFLITHDEHEAADAAQDAFLRAYHALRSFQLVLPIIRHHHEKFDGSGYPDRLQREQIPLTAWVLQIVDVYDALTTERPYKRALNRYEALDTMAQEVEQGWWDPEVFANCLDFHKPKSSSIDADGPTDYAAPHIEGRSMLPLRRNRGAPVRFKTVHPTDGLSS